MMFNCWKRYLRIELKATDYCLDVVLLEECLVIGEVEIADPQPVLVY